MAKKADEEKKIDRVQAMLDLDEDFPILSVLDKLIELGPELTRLYGELSVIRSAQTTSGEAVVLRWEKPMSRLDFIDLISDIKTAISQVSNRISELDREQLDMCNKLLERVT